MMKTRKWIAFALVIVMALSLAACAGTPSTPASDNSGSGASNSAGTAASGTAAPAGDVVAENRDPVTVKWWYPMHVNDIEEDYDNAPMDVLLAEKTGVSIEWELVPATNVDERYNLLMASGDLPDMVTRNVTLLKKYPDAWLPLDSLVKGSTRYANLDQYIYGDEFLMSYLPSDDGQNRIIPCLATRTIGDMLLVREDLMAQWNLTEEDLVTLDDWHNVLTMAKDNGYTPFMSRYKRAAILYRLLGGYSDCMKEDYYEDGGVVKYGCLEPRFKEVVEIARQWYSEGLIDPEYPTTDATIWWEQVLAGNVFATHDNITRIGSANQDFQESQNVEYRLMGVGPMESPVTGTRNTTIHYPRVRDKCNAIAASSKNAERILDYFDYIFSDEGFYIANWGVEGYSYEMVDGMPVAIAEYTEKSKDRQIQKVGTRDMPKNQADELIYNYNIYDYHQNILKARDLYEANDFIRTEYVASISFTDAEQSEMQATKAELDTYRGEMLDKFIMGIESMDKWDSFVEELKAMGVEETLKIYQDGLDRLLGQ